jgi:hypothetical protein
MVRAIMSEGEEAMATTRKGEETTRETAEARFDRVRNVATEETQKELTAARNKTARLKALRQAKEAAQMEQESKKPARAPRKKR